MVATSQLSPSALEERSRGITATDIAAICGVHPYKSAVNVWSEKLGRAPTFEGNDRTKWGNLLEPVLRADYEQRKAVRVEVHGVMTNRERDWMKASPDGLVYERDDVFPARGLEIKCHTIHLAYLYGSPGSDEVPQYELCQTTWGMAVTGLKRWDLVAFIDGQPIDYAIDRDDDLISILRDRGERFLVDYVQKDVPPPPDGSEQYSEWLKVKHRSDNSLAAMVRVDNEPETMAAIDELRALRDVIAEKEEREGLVVQALKARIGDAGGIEWPNGKPAAKKGKLAGIPPCDRITWKHGAGSSYTDYRGTLSTLQLRAQLLASNDGAFERAITALDRLANETFANTRATITATDVRDLLVGAREFVNDAARVEAPKIATGGHRSFRVPRNWKTTKSGATPE